MKLMTREGRTYPLNRDRITLGRSSSNDIQIADDLASGRHALLCREGHSYVLTDQHSTNGTYVNRRRLQGAYRLQPGDVIGIGRTLLKVTESAEARDNRTVVARQAPEAQPPAPYPPPPGAYPYPAQAGHYPAPQPEKNRITAGLLALFLGNLGIHKFYLGQSSAGILYLLFSWTFIPGIIALIEGIQYISMSEMDFQRRFG